VAILLSQLTVAVRHLVWIAVALENRLFLISGLLVCTIIFFAVLGEKTLSLFGGDRELAARFYKSGAAFLAGTAFSLAMPKLFQFFAFRAQTTIGAGGSDSRIAHSVMAPSFPDMMLTIGYGVLTLFLIATIVLTIMLWTWRIPA